jgi:hypothetical protein
MGERENWEVWLADFSECNKSVCESQGFGVLFTCKCEVSLCGVSGINESHECGWGRDTREGGKDRGRNSISCVQLTSNMS